MSGDYGIGGGRREGARIDSEFIRYKDQDYYDLKRNSQESGVLFEDPEFPASNSLLVDDHEGQSFIVSYFGRTRFENNGIQWMRPHEICQLNGLGQTPEMFVDGTDRFDINQGEIGDCWFLAAVANLVEDEECFARVVPQDQSFQYDYAGIFRFRFWRFGQWIEVVVDDRLPIRNGKLIYLRSIVANEFWGALLEKAYAKLYGSYKALEGGLTMDASVDFTGGIPEIISLDDLSMSPERLFYIMSKADSRGAFMGAAVTTKSRYSYEAQNKGLQSRHAYTITKVVEIRLSGIRGGVPLIRLRNPHGNYKEWKGDWADGDRNWQAIPTYLRQRLGLTFEDDGEFYMSFRDFCKYFGELEICHLSPDAAMTHVDPNDRTSSRQFDSFYFHGAWSRADNTAGGCGNQGQEYFANNPQFFINLSDPDPYDDETECSVIVSVLQKASNRKSVHAIGFKVYQCDLTCTELDKTFIMYNKSIDRTDTFINLREVSKRLILPEGRYCIIPCTFELGKESEFLVRVFIESQWGSSSNSATEKYGGTSPYSFDNVDNAPPSDRFEDMNIGSSGKSVSGKKKKRDKLIGCALKTLEQHFPKGAKGLRKLKEFYNWAQDSESEFALLKKIIGSLK